MADVLLSAHHFWQLNWTPLTDATKLRNISPPRSPHWTSKDVVALFPCFQEFFFEVRGCRNDLPKKKMPPNEYIIFIFDIRTPWQENNLRRWVVRGDPWRVAAVFHCGVMHPSFSMQRTWAEVQLGALPSSWGFWSFSDQLSKTSDNCDSKGSQPWPVRCSGSSSATQEFWQMQGRNSGISDRPAGSWELCRRSHFAWVAAKLLQRGSVCSASKRAANPRPLEAGGGRKLKTSKLLCAGRG